MSEFKSALIGVSFIVTTLFTSAVVVKWIHNQGLDVYVGVIVGLLPSIILVYQRRKEREQDHKNWLLQNKEGCAIELVDIFISAAFNSKHLTEKSKSDDTLKRVKRLLPSLIVWGSPKLLRQWEDMQNAPNGDATDEVVRRGERFLRVIRQNLGHDDSELKPGALWASIVKPEEKEQVYKACQGDSYD